MSRIVQEELKKIKPKAVNSFSLGLIFSTLMHWFAVCIIIPFASKEFLFKGTEFLQQYICNPML